ncbi:MAG TPA: ATPase, T2SS/T4P/T4SS family [Acidimicrobiia bacterium]
MITSAYEEIRHESVRLVEDRNIDTASDLESTRKAVSDTVEAYQRRAHLGRARALSDPTDMVDRVVRAIVGFGPLTDLLERQDIEEVFIEGTRVSFLDGEGRLAALRTPVGEVEARHVVERLLAETDRRLDAASPVVQARVLGGSARLTAVIPPVAEGLSASIRRYALRTENLESLVKLGSMTPAAAGFLRAAMQTDASVLISGPPGSGKTSLLAALLAAAPPTHCIRCCEEVRELHVPIVHGSYYEARPPGVDGSGEISLRALVKLVLAMRPDRIVIGEVRGSEAFELTRAANAGCGFACTIHANSAREALTAVVNAALMAGENVPEPFVRRVLVSAVDVVVHLERDSIVRGLDGLRRQVTEILAMVPSLHDDFSVEPLFLRERLGGPLIWTGALPPAGLADRIARSLPSGIDLRDVMSGRAEPL